MNRKLLSLLTIPLLATIVFFIAQAYPLLTYFGLSSVVEEMPASFDDPRNIGTQLLKNKKIVVTFKATENNLGVVLVRFVKLGKGEDTLEFRLRRQAEKKWYYTNKYYGHQFESNQYYPFGFPALPNSKNNIYVFEIESLSGKSQNGAAISKNKPRTAFVYNYKTDKLKNPITFLSFVFKKSFYVLKNVDYPLLASIFVLSVLFVRFFLSFKKNPRRTILKYVKLIKSFYLPIERKTIRLIKQLRNNFTSIKIYQVLLNSNTKKRLTIGLIIFLLAFTYRFSMSLIDQPNLFYAGLGGQGDYDQFIRAATCAVREFCPEILHQNLFIESTILGIFYEIFGFAGGLKAYLYLMIIASSIVATLPYLLLTSKKWFSLGGIMVGLYLATSDFLTHVALNYPPDNGSLFTFSMFFIAYLLTMHSGTIRWLLLFGFVGFFDGMFKALFLINDLVAFVLFSPVFFYEKVRHTGKSMFRKKNIKILFLSLIPLIVFLIPYLAWEYFVYAKWTARYFLGGLLFTRGEAFVSYTTFNEMSSAGNIFMQFLYLAISMIVMLKRIIQYSDLQIIFLAPIYLGLLFFSFTKVPRSQAIKKLAIAFISSVVVITLLTLIKNNYFKIHEIFSGEYILATWIDQTYVSIFLLSGILMLFILNFKHTAIKLSLPIIPYFIMLIILTKNSPFPRISTQVVVWMIILLAFLIDWLFFNINSYSKKKTNTIKPAIVILFLALYIFPKASTMITQLYKGVKNMRSETKYLQWVNSSLPHNAIVLAGGRSNLVTVSENINKPIIYNSIWSAALLIKPNKIPGRKPTDFTIIGELQNKDNFKRNKYLILENDIYLWRARLREVDDNIFAKVPNTLHADDFSIKVYKFNPTLKKAIYELNIRENKSIN